MFKVKPAQQYDLSQHWVTLNWNENVNYVKSKN